MEQRLVLNVPDPGGEKGTVSGVYQCHLLPTLQIFFPL